MVEDNLERMGIVKWKDLVQAERCGDQNSQKVATQKEENVLQVS